LAPYQDLFIMKPSILLFLTFLFFSSCEKGSNSVNVIPVGTFQASDNFSVEKVYMYTNSSYIGTGGPITDTLLIKNYILGNNISGFYLNSTTQAAPNRIVIIINDSAKVSIMNNSSNTQAKILFNNNQTYHYYYCALNTTDTLFDIVPNDSIYIASIPTDSCYNRNATAVKQDLYGVTGVDFKKIYYKKYPIQFMNNDHLRIHLMSVSLKSSANNCFNSVTDVWGYDRMAREWGGINHLVAGDTLIIQTRLIDLFKTN
jgi:hypothetical protein